jgi:hypothetical protein
MGLNEVPAFLMGSVRLDSSVTIFRPGHGVCSTGLSILPFACRSSKWHCVAVVKADPINQAEVINMLGTILLIVLILLLIGALPSWPHSRAWGYGPTGGIGVVLIVVIVLLVVGVI